MAVVIAPPFNIVPPDVKATVAPVLAALVGAAISTTPPETVLPALTPILRQRVQLLSAASTEPWIRLLTYDPAKVALLSEIATSGTLDPHPVSGEIEVDWDYDVESRYKRVDQETLHTLVVLRELKLLFRLLYCTGDPDGGDGWRVAEVGVPDASTFGTFSGFLAINEAESSFQTTRSAEIYTAARRALQSTRDDWSTQTLANNGDDDDDDDYWGRYDATPSRTPVVQRSPAPPAVSHTPQLGDIERSQSTEAENAYFAMYDSVQPAMDNHDPDEEMHQAEYTHLVPPSAVVQPLRVDVVVPEPREVNDGPALAQPVPIKPGSSRSSVSRGSDKEAWVMANPRPSSSASSNASQTVAKLEEAAESRGQAEYGVKQHVGRSIRSLFLLSRASGIDREEFERMVRTELDVLGMVEDDI